MRLKHTLVAAAAVMAIAGQAYGQEINVKIGVMNDRSGLYADLTGEGSVVAARMAAEDFDVEGKGWTIEFVSADHQNKPDVASTIARTWYDEDGVDVIVDVPTSSAALAVNQITREKDKVFLVSGAASSDLTGSQCSPNTIHWTYDTWALANGTGKAMVESGGKVVGKVRHPFPGTDFSSFLLQAQTSKAKIIGLANAGGDTINSIKQASEFGIVQAGQNLAGLLVFITDVNALGLQTAQGLVLTSAFYWDQNDDTRAWAKRFAENHNGNMPTMIHAGVYSALMHYFKALEALGSAEDSKAVVEQMKAMPTSDQLLGEGEVRADGRKIHKMYLFEVKSPEESKGAWDYYKLVNEIPADQAFRPIGEGGCELVQ